MEKYIKKNENEIYEKQIFVKFFCCSCATFNLLCFIFHSHTQIHTNCGNKEKCARKYDYSKIPELTLVMVERSQRMFRGSLKYLNYDVPFKLLFAKI